MTDKILKYIETIRSVMKEKHEDFPYGCCHETSIIFTKVLEILGIKSKVYEGYWNGFEHFWNKVDDNMIDLTLDQFENENGKYGVIEEVYYQEWYEGKEYNLDWLETDSANDWYSFDEESFTKYIELLVNKSLTKIKQQEIILI